MGTMLLFQILLLFLPHPEFPFPTDSLSTDSFTDNRDGHLYKVVKLGDQWWMAENLAFLPSVNPADSGSFTQPFCYVYNYRGNNTDSAKASPLFNLYGTLYNWPAAMDNAESSSENPSGVKGICPEGWHLPGDNEWNDLENYLITNGFNYDSTNTEDKTATSLSATINWRTSPLKGSPGFMPERNNRSGFGALSGGRRDPNNSFTSITSNGYWWSAKENNETHAWCRSLNYYYDNLSRYHLGKDYGFSVRCVRDRIHPGTGP